MKQTNIIKWVDQFRSSQLAVVLVGSEGIWGDCLTKGILIVITPFLLERNLGLKGEYNGMLNAIASVAGVVSSLGLGYLSDKLGGIRRPFYTLPCIFLIFLGILLLFSTAFWQLIVGRVCYGLYMGVGWSIGVGAINDVYPNLHKSIQISSAVTFAQAGYFIGPLIGGNLYDRWGTRAVGIFVLCFAVVEAVFRAFIAKEPRHIRDRVMKELAEKEKKECQDDKDQAILGDHSSSSYSASAPSKETMLASSQGSETEAKGVGSDLSYWQLVRKWPLLMIVLGTFVEALFVNYYEVVFPLELERRFSFTSGRISQLMTALTVPGMVTSVPLGRLIEHLRFRHSWMRNNGEIGIVSILGLTTLLNALIVVLMLCVKSNLVAWVVVLCFLSIIRGLLMVLGNVGLGHYMDSLNSGANAKCYAINLFVWSAGSTISPVVVAQIYESLGFDAATFITCAISLVPTTIMLSRPIYAFSLHMWNKRQEK